MYAVLKSKRGTYSVQSTTSQAYIDMISSGNYEEVYTGTKKQCETYKASVAAPAL